MPARRTRLVGCNKRFTQSSNLTAHERTHQHREGRADPACRVYDEDYQGPIFKIIRCAARTEEERKAPASRSSKQAEAPLARPFLITYQSRVSEEAGPFLEHAGGVRRPPSEFRAGFGSDSSESRGFRLGRAGDGEDVMRELLREEFGAEFKRIKLDESSERSVRHESCEAFGMHHLMGKESAEGLAKDHAELLLGGEVVQRKGSLGSTSSALYNEHRFPVTNLFL